MQKALLFIFTLIFGTNLMAQVAPNKVLNASDIAVIDDKVIMSGDPNQKCYYTPYSKQ